jgi:hypothetical protein
MFVTTSARTGTRTLDGRADRTGHRDTKMLQFRRFCVWMRATGLRSIPGVNDGAPERRPKEVLHMGYELMGRIHAAVHRLVAEQRGQGTVEYVGLILLVAGLLATIVLATKKMHGTQGISQAIAKHLRGALDTIR